MKKAYGALKWLNMAQALEYLESLTNEKVTKEVLLQFCCEKEAGAYVFIDIPGAEGKTSRTKEKVNLIGMQEVLNPHMAFRDEDQTCGILKHGDEHWIGLMPRSIRTAQFKSADIEAIAAKMNGTLEQPRAELEALRQQLEQERTARQVAEQRAEQAAADSLRQRPASVGAADQEGTGLTFPYATKQLEAARAAALAYWCDFDPERPPLQKSVAGFMADRGVPVRQAQELASAIKPDDLQKA